METESGDSWMGGEHLRTFFFDLAKDERVRKELKEIFGEAAADLLAKMALGESLESEEDVVEEVLVELVGDGSDVVHSLDALGEEEFSINILQFGPVFWIQANEFDDIGYFSTLERATAEAEAEYESFITAFNEQEEDEDEAEEDEEP